MGIEPNRGNRGLGIKPRVRNHEVLKSPDNLFFIYLIKIKIIYNFFIVNIYKKNFKNNYF